MIKFYWNNLLDGAGLVSSSENLQFPLANLKKEHRTKVFRSIGSTGSVTLDVGATEKIDSFFLVDNPIDGLGLNSLTISASQSPSFSPDLLGLPVPLNAKYGQGFLRFPEVEARYFRLTMGSSLPYSEVSKFFVGKEMQLIDGKSINFGWTHQEEEILGKSFNRYGQQFTDLVGTFRKFNISFSNLSKDQLEQIDEMTDYCGTHRPFFVRIGCPDITNSLERFSGMVYLENRPVKTNTFFNRYGLSMALREAR
jgi:hypothetical protein